MATTTQTPKRRRKRSQGTARTVKIALYSAVNALEARLINDTLDLSELCRLSHALATAAGAWSRLHEQHELEQRVAQLEAEAEGRQQL